VNPAWFMRPDWPMEREIQRRADLMAAIRALPCGDAMTDDMAEGGALMILSACHSGRDEALARNRPASQKASEAELERLANLAAQLSIHINAMHRPAVNAIWKEAGDNLFTVAEQMGALAQAARDAHGEIAADASGRGASRKAEAEEVAEAAGRVFERVTGNRPTITVAPDVGRVSGPWRDFLGRVFSAMRIAASPDSQAKTVMELYRPKSRN